MKILAIHHVQLAMPAQQEAAARRFYAGVLGLEEVEKPPQLAVRGGAWFERGATRVHLGVEEDFRSAQKAHPAFLVEDLKALLNRCRDAGVSIVMDQSLRGFERAYVYDPFGNRIELLEAAPGRKHSR